MRLPVSAVILAVLLSACSACTPGDALTENLRELPFHFPCQRDTRCEEVRQSSATYVPGPMVMLGCITDREGGGIAGTGAVPETEDAAATMTAEGRGQTGEDGRYLVPGVADPGWYTITATAHGYKPVSKRVLFRGGYTTVLDFELEREP